MSLHFPKRLSIEVKNHLTRASYLLKRIDEVEPTEERKKQIVSICNEPKVYSWLFKDIFENSPYTEDQAENFFELGSDGWNENRMFIFLLLSSSGQVAVAIDIKSSEIENAEVGYWASDSHRGCMTNTTTELLKLARAAGFRGLFGRTKKGNIDSVGVLLRAGFRYDVVDSEQSETHDYYRVDLQGNESQGRTVLDNSASLRARP